MDHYHYRCFQCHSKFSIEKVETKLQYLCPRCGKAAKNQPLDGVLWIEYDYSHLKRVFEKDRFLFLPTGQFWQYAPLFPLNFETYGPFHVLRDISFDQIERLSLNKNPLFIYKTDDRPLWVFDDTVNPTLSFKDRASCLVAVKAMQMGIKEIATASTGNAASSLAGICARLGLKAHIFVPSTIPTGKRIQIQTYGAELYVVDGDYDQAFDLCLEVAEKKGWYIRNTAYNPLTIEGKKTAAYDIFLETEGDVPDVIFVPVGDGVIISGIFKGFWELKKMGWIKKIPRMIAVQAEGSDALLRYLEDEHFEFQPAHSIADSICAGAPRNLYMAAYSVQRSRGMGVAVSDEEMLTAQRRIAEQMGILVEPAAAASMAGYMKLKETDKLKRNDKVLLLFTGHGLKDVESLQKGSKSPDVKTVDEWKKYFEIR